jgi:hypothetical protein
MLTYRLTRRAALGLALLPLFSGCSTPLPMGSRPAGDAAAARRVQESAEAHGLTAYRALTDINVSYSGEWRPLIDRIQPELVDAGYRGTSEERLMPAAGVVAQAYMGPLGRKQCRGVAAARRRMISAKSRCGSTIFAAATQRHKLRLRW